MKIRQNLKQETTYTLLAKNLCCLRKQPRIHLGSYILKSLTLGTFQINNILYFLILKNFIKFIGVTLVNKSTQISGIQFCNISSAYYIVNSPPKVQSPSHLYLWANVTFFNLCPMKLHFLLYRNKQEFINKLGNGKKLTFLSLGKKFNTHPMPSLSRS